MGLALDEPNEGDARSDANGVPVLVSPEVARWMAGDAALRIDFHRTWGSFSVRLEGQQDCC